MATQYKPMDVQVDGNGLSMPGAKIYFYATGTSTPQDTYSDSALVTPNTNPVVADSNGLWPPIYLGTTNYKAILKTAADVTLQTLDPVLVNPQAASLSSEMDSAFGTTEGSLLERGSSAWAAVTFKSVLDRKFGTTRGTLLYRGASDWTTLAPPASAGYLTHAGTGNDPAWALRASAYVTISGTTPTIAKQVGFTSVARTGTGLYTCTLSTAMPDVNYRISALGAVDVSGGTPNGLLHGEDNHTARSTTVFHLVFGLDSSGLVDPTAISIEVFG